MKNLLLFLLISYTGILFSLEHSGIITSDEYWDNTMTHLIVDNLTINSGVTVTIEEGALIRFYENCILQVNGTLVAEGTPNNRIMFTSRLGGLTAGFWKYIYFQNSDSGCSFDYCDFWYGGSSEGMIYIVNSGNNISITNCEIHQSGSNGIYMFDNATPTIENCVITDSESNGIYCAYSDCQPNIHNCDITDNGESGIVCAAGAGLTISDSSILDNPDYSIKVKSDYISQITGSMNLDAPIYVYSGNINSGTWKNYGVPYIISDDLILQYGRTLTLSAGVIFKFDGNYYFQVKGCLIAEGTADDRIVFTSNQSSPSPGDWKYIYFYESDSGTSLKYCDIHYGGSESNRGSIYIDESGNHIQFEHCNIEYSADHGVFLWANSSPSFINCKIRNNASYGVRVYSNSSHPIFGSCLSEWNDIYNNNEGGYRNSNISNTAEYIYWGTTDQNEIDNLIYDNEEGAYSVDFTPWTNGNHDAVYPQTTPDIPQNITIEIIDGSTARISWDASSQATQYRVEYADTPNGTFTTAATTTNTTVDISIADGKKFYRVIAIN